MKTSLQLGFVCGLVATAAGLQPVFAVEHALTLEGAIERARAHGPAARRLELERRGAQISTRSAARRTWPEVGFDLEAPRWSQDFLVEPLPSAVVDTVVTGEGDTVRVTQEVFGKTTTTRRNASGALRYRHLLPWRGTLEGDWTFFRRDESTSPAGVRSGRGDTEVQAGIGLQLPLLGPDVERSALRRAQHEAAAARERISGSEAQLEFDCTTRYLAILRARFALEVERTEASNAAAALELAEQKVRAGLAPEVDRMRMAVHRAERDARQAEADAEFDRSLDEYKIFLGFALADSIELIEPLAAFAVDVDAEAAVRAALERRSEIGIAAADIELLEADRRARRPHWPQVELSARYGGSASQSTFDQALRDLAANSTSFALRLHLPLWDGGRGALADAEDRTTIELRRLDLEETRNRIELEVRDAVRRMVDASRRLVLLETSNSVAEEQLRINTERYERGLLDTTGFLASQAEAEAARLGRMSALLDLYHARARLRLLTLEGGS